VPWHGLQGLGEADSAGAASKAMPIATVAIIIRYVMGRSFNWDLSCIFSVTSSVKWRKELAVNCLMVFAKTI
jgi:hypothetical protein